ncbi:MAG TPA: YceI family protein [Chitinophagales bacterium]
MATTKWAIDPTHSEIGFKVKHMMFTNVSGKFEKFEATVEAEDDNFENAKIEFSAEAASVSTGNADRDNHLKSGDFFDATQFPTLSFKATSFKKINSEDFELTGDFTLHGVTKTITLPVEFGGLAKDPWGNTKAGFAISGKLNRKDFGLNWNATLEAGGVLVGEEVKLAIELQLLKQA